MLRGPPGTHKSCEQRGMSAERSLWKHDGDGLESGQGSKCMKARPELGLGLWGQREGDKAERAEGGRTDELYTDNRAMPGPGSVLRWLKAAALSR